MKKFIIALLSFIFITITLTACDISFANKENRAREALQERYDEEFEILKVYPTFPGRGYFSVLASPTFSPDILFRADIDTNDENFSDTYIERLVCRQIADKVSENLNLASASAFVHAMGAQPVSRNTAINVKDYISLGGNDFSLYLFVPPEKISEILPYMEDMSEVIDCRMTGFLRIYLASEKEIQSINGFLSTIDDGVYDPEFKDLTKDLSCYEREIKNGQISDYESLREALTKEKRP